MATIVISFLGMGNYDEVEYTWGDSTYRTRLFPAAVAHWIRPDRLYVLLTDEARDSSNWVSLQEELKAQQIEYQEVSIPSGRSESELWEIFEQLVGLPQEDDEIILDITHGFRSLPALALLAMVYLRIVKQVNLLHILYGAYEARQPNSDLVPTFDLTPFVTLLEWASAADQFLNTGNSTVLGKLFTERHNALWRRREGQPKALQRLGNSLTTLSEIIASLRAREVPTAAHNLVSALEEAEKEKEVRTYLPPAVPILENVRQAYEPFAVGVGADDLEKPDDIRSHLRVQWELLREYIRWKQWVQAVTLAREWVVTLACWRCGSKSFLDVGVRERIANELESSVRKFSKQSEADEKPKQDVDLTRLDEAEKKELMDAWARIGQLRNDIAHCGMRKKQRSARDVIEQAENLASLLEPLARQIQD
ncbi:MAG TPA: TIGR02221 family CRISPR-associated protein [Chthonomonas sp.]|uniref:TIGR02221 family CRISPR-associated protein n=1 Tax=Chthonomonas sp. TaxID=2282153 RepID=UPI002B4B8A83|nr:TIGR02221 family CRISPR-associated protein [Chthonomonas sp.]HLI49719.1 TIGR02221 family CRISPR-associated protein [Chthonomonas sp.]